MNLTFEKPISVIEEKIARLREIPETDSVLLEIEKLKGLLRDAQESVYSKLTSWETVLVARHINRPRLQFYLDNIVQDFFPIRGDRCFADDTAIKCGIGRIGKFTCMINGHNKGSTMDERVKNSFGMAKPEGYRKINRVMHIADNLGIPIVNLIDAPGAFPGIEGEERGQHHALAECIQTSFNLKVPIIAIIIGEGGSGGAVAMATANQVMMFQHSVYYTISPEGCSSILWKNPDKKDIAASALRITAPKLLQLKVIDKVIDEPIGGAHRNPTEAAQNLKGTIIEALSHKNQLTPEQRSNRFLYNFHGQT